MHARKGRRFELTIVNDIRPSTHAPTGEAAGATADDGQAALGGSSAPTAEVSADTATTTTSSEIVPTISEASAPPEVSGEPEEPEPAEPPPAEPTPDPANDNSPVEPLPATGTE